MDRVGRRAASSRAPRARPLRAQAIVGSAKGTLQAIQKETSNYLGMTAHIWTAISAGSDTTMNAPAAIGPFRRFTASAQHITMAAALSRHGFR